MELHQAIRLFQEHEKKEIGKGWTIEWAEWSSKKLGKQKWPSSIIVESEEDYLFLTKKTNEVENFKQQLIKLLSWRNEIQVFLLNRPQLVLQLQPDWDKICVVTDYLMAHDVSDHYIRSLPVPVHTKFIEGYENILLLLLKHLCPERIAVDADLLEKALGLQTKKHLFTLRLLDPDLEKFTGGMKLLGVTVDTLRLANWSACEIWLVENETNLYLMPARKGALVLFSKGYALSMLYDIPLFQNTKLYYWGDLDEDGFIMLHRMRKHYPNIQGVFMDIETVDFHQSVVGEQPSMYRVKDLEFLTNDEKLAFLKLSTSNGRIEQEKLNQKFIFDRLTRL